MLRAALLAALALAPALAGAGDEGGVSFEGVSAACTFGAVQFPPDPRLCEVAHAGRATLDHCDALGCVVRVVAEARGRGAAEVPWTLVGHVNMDYTGGNYCRAYATAAEVACSGAQTMRAAASAGECSDGTVFTLFFQSPFKFLQASVTAVLHVERDAQGTARLAPGPC